MRFCQQCWQGALKWKCHFDDNFAIGCTMSCQNDISVSVKETHVPNYEHNAVTCIFCTLLTHYLGSVPFVLIIHYPGKLMWNSQVLQTVTTCTCVHWDWSTEPWAPENPMGPLLNFTWILPNVPPNRIYNVFLRRDPSKFTCGLGPQHKYLPT